MQSNYPNQQKRFNGWIDYRDKNRTREFIETDIFYLDVGLSNTEYTTPDQINGHVIKWIIYKERDGLARIIPAGIIDRMEINSYLILREN